MIDNIYNFLFRYKWLILIGAVILYAAALFSASTLTMEENIMELLPRNDPELAQYKILLDQFNPMDVMLIDIHHTKESNLAPEDLIVLADSLAYQMTASNHFVKILYKWTISDLTKALDILRKHRTVLFNEQDKTILQNKMTTDYIREHLSDLKQQLMESPSPFLTNKLYSDPLDFDEVLLDKLNASQAMSDSISMYKGHLFTKDLRHLFIVAHAKCKSTDDYGSQLLVDFMDSTIIRLTNTPASELVKISYISGHRFSLENAQRIKKDVQLTVTVSFISIAIISLLAYSNPFLIILSLLPSIFGVGVALGIIRLINPALSAISIGSAALLIGVSADYGCHLLFHADRISSSQPIRMTISTLMKKFYQPLLLSAGTRYVAFVCLLLSTLPAYHQIGLIGCIAIAGTMVFVLFILPLLTPISKSSAKKRRPFINLTHFFPQFLKWSYQNRITLIIIIVLFTVLLIPGFLRLRFEGDVQKMNAVSDKIRVDFEDIHNSLGVALTSTLVTIRGTTLQDALVENDRLNGTLSDLKKKGIIQSYNSISQLLPANALQEQNRLRWRQLFSDSTLQQLQRNLNQVCVDLRMRKEYFAGFIASLRNDSENIEIAHMDNSLVRDMVSNQIAESHGQFALLTTVKIASEQDYETLKSNLVSFIPNITSYNGQYFISKMIQLIFKELKRLSLITFLAIIIVLWIFIKKLKNVFFILIPLLLSLFWTFGIMGFLGITINIMNCIITVFIFGLIIDESIFLFSACTRSSGDEEDLGVTSGATAISAVTTMAGLGALFLAKHPALHSLGLTAMVGIGSGLCAVFFIIPLLFIKKEFFEKRG